MTFKILIIDDEPDIVDAISFELSRLGYSISSASNGEEGYALYLKEKPDLIILDIRLPKLTGSALCRRIRRDNEDSATAIIMLTCLDDDADRIIGRVQGADKYITKPFDREYLINCVQTLLADTSS